MRLVLMYGQIYTVYENKQCIAVFELEKDAQKLTKEQVEELRTADHKKLA